MYVEEEVRLEETRDLTAFGIDAVEVVGKNHNTLNAIAAMALLF